MSSKFLCITVVFFLNHGTARTCNYRFIGLNDNITLSSSTEMYEMVHEISLHDGNRDIPAQGKGFFLNESSQYFFLEGNYMLVIACLPAGLHEVLTFIIEREETCRPGYLVIDVTPTVPVFNHIPSKVTVDVDTCSTENIIKVFDLSFENKEDCNVFNCTAECTNCPGGKRFWTQNETVIVTSTKNIRITHSHHLRVVCFDGSSTANQFDISATVAELTVEFERLNSVPCSVPATSSTTEGSVFTKTTPARTQRSSTVLTTARLPDRSSKTTTVALTSYLTTETPLKALTTTTQNAKQLKQITTGPSRPLTATVTDGIASPHTTIGPSLSMPFTTTEKKRITTNLQTSADPSKVLLTTVKNDLFPPKTDAVPTLKVTTMHKPGTSVHTTSKPSDSISTKMKNTESALRTTITTTIKKADTTPKTTTQSSKYMTTTAFKTMKDLHTRKKTLTSKSTSMNNDMASHTTKQTPKPTTTLSVWRTTSVSTTLSSITSTIISSTGHIVSVIATTAPASTSSSTSTSGSPIPNNNANDGFFNKTENIAAVSAAGGVVLVCAMISIIYAAWSKCCQEGSSSSG